MVITAGCDTGFTSCILCAFLSERQKQKADRVLVLGDLCVSRVLGMCLPVLWPDLP